MSEAELAEFYAGYTKKTGSADEDDLLFSTPTAEAETLTSSQAAFLADHVEADRGRVLDIGSGKGAFLRAFKSRLPQWQCAGVEPSREEAALARKDGESRLRRHVRDVCRARSFDPVSIRTAEHLRRRRRRSTDPRSDEAGGCCSSRPKNSDITCFTPVLFEHRYTSRRDAGLAVGAQGFEVRAQSTSRAKGPGVIARRRTRRFTRPDAPRERIESWRSVAA